MTMTAPVAVVDILSSLLDATLNSVFRFMGEGSPYLSRAAAEVRKPLADMVTAEQRRAQELAEMIETLGSAVVHGSGVRRDEQYLAFLSLKFLLPKLVHEKLLQVERYENALPAIPRENPEVKALVEAHLAQHQRELAQLQHASDAVVAAAKNAQKPL